MCDTPSCALPAALLHGDARLCVPCYRAHPGTVLQPLPGQIPSGVERTG